MQEGGQTAEFRFYEELNDVLPAERRKRSFAYAFHGTLAVKDASEAIGVPHTEVDLILVNGVSVVLPRILSVRGIRRKDDDIDT